MQQRIYVGNLPSSAREEDLERLFAPFGVVHAALVPSDRETEDGQHFGFVEMDAEDARRAIAALDASPYEGQPLQVALAQQPWGADQRGAAQHAYGSGDGTDELSP